MKQPCIGLFIATIAFGTLAAIGSAEAAFIPSLTEPNNDLKFFIDTANNGVTSFTGKVGKQNSGPGVTVSTDASVKTASGFATIKPVKGALLTDVTFTPFSSTQFSDFFFRGQLLNDGAITLKVTDAQGDPTQTFTFDNIKKNVNFKSLGIILDLAFPDDIRTIQTVELISDGFKQLKQIHFSTSPLAAVPVPAALPMFGIALMGLAGISIFSKRKKVSPTAMA